MTNDLTLNDILSKFSIINTLTLILTDECNLRCSYCYLSNWEANYLQGKKMSEVVYLRALELLEDNNAAINFSGGEPMLCFPDIVNIVDKVYSMNLACKFGIVTNGTILDDDHLIFFKNNRFNVTVSLDSIRKVENSCRLFPNGKDTVDIVISNIKRLLAEFIPVTVRMTISESNRQFYNSVMELNQLGVNNFKIIPIINPNKSMDMMDDEFIKEMERVLQLADQRDFNVFPSSRYQSYKQVKTALFNGIVCDGGFRSLVVNSKGHIFPCTMLQLNEFKLGDLLISNEIQKMIIHKQNSNKCRGCSVTNYCNSPCYARSYLLNGDINLPDESFCKLSKFYISNAIKRRDVMKKYEWNKKFKVQKFLGECFIVDTKEGSTFTLNSMADKIVNEIYSNSGFSALDICNKIGKGSYDDEDLQFVSDFISELENHGIIEYNES